MGALIAPADRTDVETFVRRLLRLDPAALVRLRPSPGPHRRSAEGSGSAWAMLPFRVLVQRRLVGPIGGDVTVAAADLLAWLRRADDPDLSDDPDGGIERRDAQWRWPLPSAAGRAVETIPAADIAGLAQAASQTLRTAAAEGIRGRAVGERMLRDALLDHVAIVVTTHAGERVEIPQRLVQAVVRMGFLAAHTHSDDTNTNTSGDSLATVRLAMGWIGLDGLHGCAWYRPISPLRLG